MTTTDRRLGVDGAVDDRSLWGSDFPHADHTPADVDDLEELVGLIPDDDGRVRFLGGNARELFGIGDAVRRAAA